MKKSEMFNVIIDKVCEICEVRREDIINGCKLQSVVDARVIAVQYLRRIGLSNDDIAEIFLKLKTGAIPTIEEIKKKAAGIDKTFCSYSNRCLQSYAFCIMSKDMKSFCRDTYQDMYIHGMKELPD